MKILIRRLHECRPAERWRIFEVMLKECLLELGHEVAELDLDLSLPPDPEGFDLRIYAHKSKRQVAADLFYKEMHMQGLFTVDHQGWGADHSESGAPPNLDGTPAAEATALCRGLREQFLSSGLSKHLQPEMRPVPEHVQPYVLVPLQVPTDDAITGHSPVSIVQFIDTLSDWAERRRQNLVFKLHPGLRTPGIAEAMERRASAEGPVFLLNENIHSLIAQSKGVMVINSGTGFESLIHGWPVVTFGECDYQCATFRAGLGTLDAAMEYIEGYSEEQRAWAYRFVHHYYHRHAYNMRAPDLDGVRARLFGYLQRTCGAGCKPAADWQSAS